MVSRLEAAPHRDLHAALILGFTNAIGEQRRIAPEIIDVGKRNRIDAVLDRGVSGGGKSCNATGERCDEVAKLAARHGAVDPSVSFGDVRVVVPCAEENPREGNTFVQYSSLSNPPFWPRIERVHDGGSMNTPSPVAASGATTGGYNNAAFWEGLWRGAGLQFVALAVIAYFVYGFQPGVGASSDVLADFLAAHRTRILIATIISGLAILNLLWFAAAVRATLADAGRDGWGAAVTASSAAVAALFFLIIAVGAALAYSIDGFSRDVLAGLNDFAWAAFVLSSFPRAMLVMSVTFGLWRASLISNAMFAVGISVVVLVLLGGTTWFGGIWGPDGAYSRFVSPVLGLAWVLVVGRIIGARATATRTGW